MARVDYDGVIQAVHYDNQGQVEWVRAFLRRGPVWSDYVQLDRDDLVDKINSGLTGFFYPVNHDSQFSL